MQCYLTINSQTRDCRACRDGGESRKRRKSNARVESAVEQDRRASRLLLVLTKPPFIANLIFGSKVVKCYFQNGSGDISNESGEQGLSISRLHSHEALSRHGVHTSRVIFCEEFAFVADERLCVEFERFAHCLRDPAFQHKLATWHDKRRTTLTLTPTQPRHQACFPIHVRPLSLTCCRTVRTHRRRRDFGLCCTL